MRLFIAVDLSAEVKQQVVALLAAATSPAARWVKAEGLHLTLVFLGETKAEAVETVKATVAQVAARHRPLVLKLNGSGTFGRPARVLWLGVEGELEPLRALQAELAAALQVKDEHPQYSPHLTLARAKKEHGDRALEELAAQYASTVSPGFGVGEVVLYQSKGGHYLVVARFPLTPIDDEP